MPPIFRPTPLTNTPDTRRRFWFTAVTLFATVCLIAWGAFVTSISAGLAVPDWPTSFGSWNQLNPWPEWWSLRPVVAEHGHRLIGALVGFLTLVLAAWTYLNDPRRSMRILGLGALLLVIVQGVLGGLRVVWVSLDLAVVHACMAQLFFATLVALLVFTSRTWVEGRDVPSNDARSNRLTKFAGVAVGMLYVQIVLGALLRHPGEGIDFTLSMMHIAGAILATVLIVATFIIVRNGFAENRILRKSSHVVVGLLALQVLLGLTAYFVLLDAGGRLQPGNLQVIVNSGHVVVGALLFGSAVALLLFSLRRRAPVAGEFIEPKFIRGSNLLSEAAQP